MLTQNSNILVQSGKTLLRRGRLALVGGLALATLMFAGTQANARPVEFRFTGGSWSHGYHAGWHRYWGGPTIGFYYAPVPVYVVAGYEAPSYYVGSDYWYSNPSFGLSFGGGGYVGRGFHRGPIVPHHGPYHGGDRFGHGFHGRGRSFGHGSFRGEHRR